MVKTQIHQGLHCLLRLKRSSDKKMLFFLIYNPTTLDIYNGPYQVYLSSQKEESISIQFVNICSESFKLVYQTKCAITLVKKWQPGHNACQFLTIFSSILKYPGIQFRLPCSPPGQFFMGAKLFIGTPWMGNEGVLKKNGLGFVKLHCFYANP